MKKSALYREKCSLKSKEPALLHFLLLDDHIRLQLGQASCLALLHAEAGPSLSEGRSQAWFGAATL